MGGIGSGGSREGSGRKCIDGEPRGRISVTLPGWLLVSIRKEAESQQMSASSYITEIIHKGISK